MNLDVENLIKFFEKNTTNSSKLEMGEQDAAGGATGGKGNNPSKWADTVGGPKRGVANSLPKKGQFWAQIHGGPARGVANKLGTA